ncbi:MAG: ABC transporter permease [Bacteroidales bacterium]|nr:ABC transporter permease [Bacteroidales bacterium]
MRTLGVLLEKEFLQLFRDPFMPKMIVFFPILVMLIFPWVATLEVKDVRVTVVDQDNSSLSRLISNEIEHSAYFEFQEVAKDYDRALLRLEEDRTDAIVSIPAGFEESLLKGSPKKISISANAVNAVKGSVGSQYLTQITGSAQQEFLQEKGIQGLSVPEVTVTNRYNETLVYRNYMIPALMIMLLILVCGFLPALNIVNEKERGTIEQINVTPVKQSVFMLAKLIPFWVIGLVVVAISIFTSFILYGLVPSGSWLEVFLACMIFIILMSALGVVVANYSSTMIEAIFLMFFVIMIFVLMGGLLTPIESMPEWAQYFTFILPSRYFNTIMRATYLKGASILDLRLEYAALAAFGLIFGLLAAITYRKRS